MNSSENTQRAVGTTLVSPSQFVQTFIHADILVADGIGVCDKAV